MKRVILSVVSTVLGLVAALLTFKSEGHAAVGAGLGRAGGSISESPPQLRPATGARGSAHFGQATPVP